MGSVPWGSGSSGVRLACTAVVTVWPSPAAPAVPGRGREQRAAGIGAGTVRAARDAVHV